MNFFGGFTAALLFVAFYPCFGTTTNEREFYIVLESLGPTGDGNMESPDTLWAKSRVWSKDYLSVSMNWNTPVDAIQEARNSLNWSVYLTAHTSKWRSSTPVPNITKAIASLLAAGIPKDEILWEYICEDDSAGAGYSQELLKMSRHSGYSNGATRLRPEDAFLGWQDYVGEAYEIAQAAAKEARLYARPGFASNAHAVINYADTILIERVNDDVGSLPPAISFSRGASRQYNVLATEGRAHRSSKPKRWGIDLSLWWGGHRCVCQSISCISAPKSSMDSLLCGGINTYGGRMWLYEP